ncbi:hypothetical protein ACQ4PT_039932 [Festuca glaucescens]
MLREGFGELHSTSSRISLPPASNGQLNLPEHMSSMKNLFVEQDGNKAKRAVAQLHYDGRTIKHWRRNLIGRGRFRSGWRSWHHSKSEGLDSEKHSKTPKSRQKNSNTKFKRMKQRLQYKSVSEGDGHEEQSPLQSVPPLHDVHPIAFEPAPRVDCPNVEEENPGVETNVASKKEKVNLFNRSSPMKVVRLKACFRNKSFLFSAEPSVVDMFIKRHAPVSLDDEIFYFLFPFLMQQQLVIYREAVSSMCNVFKDGLAEFFRSFAINKGKESTDNLHQAEEDVQNISKQKHRRRVTHVTEGGNRKEVLLDHMEGTTEVEVAPQIINEAKSKKIKADDRCIAAARPKKKKMKGAVISPEEHVVIEDHQKNVGTEDHKEEATAKLFEEKASDGQTDQKVGNSDLAEDEQQTHINVEIQEPVEVNKEVSAIVAQETEVSLTHTNMGDALRNLQFYGTGSQSSTETPLVDNPVEGIQGDQEEEGSEGSGQLRTRTKKSVSFSDQGKVSPIGRRPVTRSMSPLKSPIIKQDLCYVSSSPRRLTRFATAEARAIASLNKVSNSPPSAECHKPTPAAKLDRSMTKELAIELESVQTTTEIEHQRKEQDSEVQEVIVISSNEDSGDSLDKIYAAIEMPSSSGKGIVLQHADTSPRTPGSSTPIPQTRRVVKLGPQQKSPFVTNAKKPSVPQSDSELYNKVCMYGGKSKDLLNDERIIDYGNFFIYLRDLADSVKPEGWISNSTCEIALEVLSAEMAKQNFFIMPLRIATKLRSATTCLLDRSVKKAFEYSPTHRLDHKDMIMFSFLQDLTPDIKLMTGHYYLIVLNLKSGRYDCGYFVLKFIEEWNGRKMLAFSPSDMPALRKLNLKKWMDYCKNTIDWEELLFP